MCWGPFAMPNGAPSFARCRSRRLRCGCTAGGWWWTVRTGGPPASGSAFHIPCSKAHSANLKLQTHTKHGHVQWGKLVLYTVMAFT